MSIRVMTKVWERSRSKNGARLVLLALADFADDGGGAYPSVPSLAKKTLLSERAVQAGLKELVALGELSIKANEARHGCNYYIINVTPADSAPPKILHPAEFAPPQILHPTPADSAPEPSENRQVEAKASPQTPEPPPAAGGKGDDQAEAETKAAAKRQRQEDLRKLSIRVGAVFRRRPETQWNAKEKTALSRLYPLPEQDLVLIERYYALLPSAFPVGFDGRNEDYRRHDLITLLNNWPGEVDRATRHFSTGAHALNAADPSQKGKNNHGAYQRTSAGSGQRHGHGAPDRNAGTGNAGNTSDYSRVGKIAVSR